MDLRSVLASVRALWWVVALLTLLGTVSGGAVSALITPLYTSHMQFFVSIAGAASTTDVFQGSQFAQQRVASYAELLAGRELAGRVVDRLDLTGSAETVQAAVEAEPLPDTVLIEVLVTDRSPEGARDLAAALATEFVDLVQELERSGGDEESSVRVALSDAPEVPEEPSEPDWIRNMGIGMGAGLLAGVALTVARRALDRSVKDPDEAAELGGAPVIGTIMRDGHLDRFHVVDRSQANRATEDYRQLRANLQFLSVDEPPKVIMVSSGLPSEGKTTTAINLALTLADAGKQVIIVEADLRKPKVTRYLGMVAGVGLTNILAGSATLADVAQSFGDKGVRVVAAGPLPPNPGELLASSQMSSLLDKLRNDNDFVLVDAPPLLPVADAIGLAPFVDGVLLSVRYGVTHKEQLGLAAQALERVGAKRLGVILNMVPSTADLASAYAYGHGYSAEVPTRRGRRRR